MIPEMRRQFSEGIERARITTFRQAIMRAVYVGAVLGFAIFGPFRWWIRLPLCLFVMLVWGAIASRPRSN